MKHKNGQVRTIGDNQWYVSLGNSYYLKKDGEAFLWENDVHNSKTYPLIMHENREQAQATLDKYNKSESTISEVKEKLSAAKKLIGKKIKVLKGLREGLVGIVSSVALFFDESAAMDDNVCPGPLGLEFLEDNGYVIYLRLGEHNFRCLYDDGMFETVPSISIKNHSGEEYFAEQYDKYWQFGCAKISKSLIAESLTLMQTAYSDSNRAVSKITIGAADFDFETLKKLVDADNNKG